MMDVLALLPFPFDLIFENSSMSGLRVIRVIRFLRVFRLFKLSRLMKDMQMIVNIRVT
jgi:potassium voltage-gated channel Shaker-related subfamily A protein 2